MRIGIFASLVSLVLFGCSHRADLRQGRSEVPWATPAPGMRRLDYEASGRNFVIATQGKGASKAATAMWQQGGNIIDAAVAASFAISVERPHSTGLGGGGFFLFRSARDQRTVAVDFREVAPRRAKPNMFLDAKGQPDPQKSQRGALAVAVPGLVPGLLEIHRRYGKLPLATVLAPAIELADKGFIIYPYLADAIAQSRDALLKGGRARDIFLDDHNEPRVAGERLVQHDLSLTLKRLAVEGVTLFTKGAVAQTIARDMKTRGGLVDAADLAAYTVKWREPLRGRYNGWEVVSMPPPSSGGVHVLQILKLLEGGSFGAPLSAEAIHREAFAMQQVFIDRARFLGDPDFVTVPTDALLGDPHIARIKARFRDDRALHPDDLTAAETESPETTNLTLMDVEGNVVVTTQTINGYFGSGIVAGDTGIVLNNEMDDFAAAVGAQNMFGAVGGAPNRVQPGKRPLSSMSPTIVLRDNRPVLALGAPGGTRILTCVAQTIVNRLGFGLPLFDSVAAVRFHHQWKPDKLEIDAPGPGDATIAQLQKLGYTVDLNRVPCRVNAAAQQNATLEAVADPRDYGSALGL